MNDENVLDQSLESVKISNLKGVHRSLWKGGAYKIVEENGLKTIIDTADPAAINELMKTLDVNSMRPSAVSLTKRRARKTSLLSLRDAVNDSLLYEAVHIAIKDLENRSTFQDFHNFYDFVNEKKAIALLNKYGIPFYGHISDSSEFLKCDYEKFCARIVVLSSCMQLLAACLSADSKTLRGKMILREKQKALIFYSYLKRHDYDFAIKFFSEDAQESGESLAKMREHSFFLIGMEINEELKSSRLFFESDSMEIVPVLDDWLSCCYYQLATLINHLINNPKNPDDSVKRCDNCGLVFWGHGKRTICYDCNRSTKSYNSPDSNARENRHRRYKKALSEAQRLGISRKEYEAHKREATAKEKQGKAGERNGNN